MYQTEKVLIIAQYATLPVSFIKSLSFHTEFKSFPLTILWSVSIWSAVELIMYLILKVAPMLCHLRGFFVSGIHSHTQFLQTTQTSTLSLTGMLRSCLDAQAVSSVVESLIYGYLRELGGLRRPVSCLMREWKYAYHADFSSGVRIRSGYGEWRASTTRLFSTPSLM